MHPPTSRIFDPYDVKLLPVTSSLSTILRCRSRVALLANVAAVVAVLLAVVPTADAQVIPGSAQAIGSMSADRARLAQLLGEPVPPTAVPIDPTHQLFVPILPSVLLIDNSSIPYTQNDGELWAGRGLNVSVTGGAAFAKNFDGFRVHAVLAPTFTYSQNRPFQFLRDTMVSRSPFSSLYHSNRSSLDLPSRFGDESFERISFGQSSIEATFPAVAIGVSSTNEWWGPGIENTLIESNTAGGIPRAYIRTAEPIRTRIGSFEGRLFAGTLTESPYFDTTSANDYRRINGLLVTYKPTFDPGLTLGFSRVVYANEGSALTTLSHPLDALLHWETVKAPTDTANGRNNQSADQLMSLFFRWVFAPAGVEIYAEYGREEFPRSLREFLVAPQSTQAYVVGFQDAYRINSTAIFRTQVEFTDLEQPLIYADRPTLDWYAGQATPQGYTQRGQLIGAATGPGSSAQFLAFDYIVPRWQFGVFAGRTRWDEDALIRQFFPNTARHDVSIYSGVRGGWRQPTFDVWGELAVSRRLNYLFQDDAFHAGTPRQAIDVQNVTLTLRFDPRGLPF